jgi:hypothetical protein
MWICEAVLLPAMLNLHKRRVFLGSEKAGGWGFANDGTAHHKGCHGHQDTNIEFQTGSKSPVTLTLDLTGQWTLCVSLDGVSAVAASGSNAP